MLDARRDARFARRPRRGRGQLVEVLGCRRRRNAHPIGRIRARVLDIRRGPQRRVVRRADKLDLRERDTGGDRVGRDPAVLVLADNPDVHARRREPLEDAARERLGVVVGIAEDPERGLVADPDALLTEPGRERMILVPRAHPLRDTPPEGVRRRLHAVDVPLLEVRDRGARIGGVDAVIAAEQAGVPFRARGPARPVRDPVPSERRALCHQLVGVSLHDELAGATRGEHGVHIVPTSIVDTDEDHTGRWRATQKVSPGSPCWNVIWCVPSNCGAGSPLFTVVGVVSGATYRNVEPSYTPAAVIMLQFAVGAPNAQTLPELGPFFVDGAPATAASRSLDDALIEIRARSRCSRSTPRHRPYRHRPESS